MKAIKLAMVLILVVAASCKGIAPKPEDQLPGKWKAGSEDKTYEFKADKTVIMSSVMMGMSLAANGTYQWNSATELQVDFNGIAAVAGSQKFAVAFTGPDQMTMKNLLTKQTTVYQRVK
jgi:hypothetical protein